jgi:hypothetical protein
MKRLFLILFAVLIHGVSSADDVLNIRTNPLMVLGSAFVNLELDFRTGEHWSVGPFAQTSTFEPLFDVGLRATYFEEGTFQLGWMTGLEVFYRHTDSDALYYSAIEDSFCNYESDTCGLVAEQRVGLSIDHGYLWRWRTFNVGLGVGASAQTDLDDLMDVSVIPNLHFSVGWVR